MNPTKVTDQDYLDFLIATPTVCSATEFARVQPAQPRPAAHDAFTRLLQRLKPDAVAPWQEVQPLNQRRRGQLTLDDSTLDKPYAQKMDLVSWHWSGKHHAVVKGINLLTLVWTDGDTLQRQRCHIGCAIRACVRLQHHRFRTGVSWFEAKHRLIRAAVPLYLSQPLYLLPRTAKYGVKATL